MWISLFDIDWMGMSSTIHLWVESDCKHTHLIHNMIHLVMLLCNWDSLDKISLRCPFVLSYKLQKLVLHSDHYNGYCCSDPAGLYFSHLKEEKMEQKACCTSFDQKSLVILLTGSFHIFHLHWVSRFYHKVTEHNFSSLYLVYNIMDSLYTFQSLFLKL